MADEEDENSSPPLVLSYCKFGTVSSRKTFGNIIVSIVGTGVLGLPYTFKASGWAAASASVLVASVLSYYCMMLLVKCRNKLEEEGHQGIMTYGDLGNHAYGHIGHNLVDLMILITQSGCCVAYLIFIGQNLSSIFTGGTSQQPLFIFILFPFQVLLAWVRSLSNLAPFSIFADACNVLAMAVVIKDDCKSFQGFDDIVAFTRWKSVPFAFGIALYCFEGFGMTLTLEGSMRKPQNFGKVLALAFLLITSVYMIFGLMGYFAFRDDTRDIVTLNLPNDWSTIVVKVGLCIALFFTFPIMMYPVHEIAEAKILACEFLTTRIGVYNPRLLKLFLDALRGVIILVIALVAVSVPGFGIFISLVGSTVCAMLSFVFPAFFHLHVFKEQCSLFDQSVDWFLISAGIAFALYGTYTTCVDLFGQQ